MTTVWLGSALPKHEDMKARAYALKLATGEKLGHCYEELAKQYGFKTYAAMRQAMQASKQARRMT